MHMDPPPNRPLNQNLCVKSLFKVKTPQNNHKEVLNYQNDTTTATGVNNDPMETEEEQKSYSVSLQKLLKRDRNKNLHILWTNRWID